MSTESKFASQSEAKRAGWFSRRHQTADAHRTTQASRPSKDERRQAGEERNKAWRELHPVQRITSLLKRRGESKRQLAKLEAKAK